MSPALKIFLGMLATSLIAAILHGPAGFGARCAALAAEVAAFANQDKSDMAQKSTVTAADRARAVADCRTGIEAVLGGKRIEFAAGGTVLTQASRDMVNAVAATIQTCQGAKIEVAGHTERVGDAAANLSLSVTRARAVMAALIAQGVIPALVSAEGYGETRPLEPDARDDNPADNRIEFTVSSDTQLTGN